MDTAVFSPERTYRYSLERELDPGNHTSVLFIMLNPSTADEIENDPTIRRCMGFAKAWGFGRLLVANLFAFRATNPGDMMRPTVEPVGPDNDKHIIELARLVDLVVCAWGVNGSYGNRGLAVAKMLRDEGIKPHHLGLTAKGFPSHPLYLKKSTQPQLWEA